MFWSCHHEIAGVTVIGINEPLAVQCITDLSETKLKGKCEVMFGEVVLKMTGIAGGWAKEGVSILLSERLLRCVIEWKEVSSRLMWVKVKIERESWVFI